VIGHIPPDAIAGIWDLRSGTYVLGDHYMPVDEWHVNLTGARELYTRQFQLRIATPESVAENSASGRASWCWPTRTETASVSAPGGPSTPARRGWPTWPSYLTRM